jgi:hypothetical protein
MKDTLVAFAAATEFWSAVVGAVVGGVIVFAVQMYALRENARQRREDHLRIQQAQANSLLFKTLRIHSNFYQIHRHLEDCFELAGKEDLEREPWQCYLPIANPRDSVDFSSEEMGMLLSQRDDDAFNLVVPLDAIHNSLIAAVRVLNERRIALTERLKPDKAEGNVLSGTLDQQEMLALRPRMIEVNTLLDGLRGRVKKDFEQSDEALERLQRVLRKKLGLAYRLEAKTDRE